MRAIQRLSTILGMLTLVVLGPVSCNKTPEVAHSNSINRLATVNGKPITQSDVDYWKKGGHGHKGANDKFDQAMLDNLIDVELIYQKGLEIGLDKEKSYQRMILTYETQLKALKRKEMVKTVMDREVRSQISVSDQEAMAYYQANKEMIEKDYHIGMIQFRTMSQAQETLKRLKAGESFEKLAAQMMPTHKMKTRIKAGDMGYIPWSQIPSQWLDIISDLQPGETSGIIRGQRLGGGIFKLWETRKNSFASFDSAREIIKKHIKSKKLDELRKAYLDNLKKEANIVQEPVSSS